MAFKLALVADVRQWLKGTSDVESSLDDVADSLDDLARETKDNAGKAADSLSREFSDAFDKVKADSRDAGRKLGDNVKDGTRKAGDGLGEFKDEANSTAREAAASFSGSFEDVADGIQETLANALAGFGPAGAAAGLAAAAGIGILISNLEDSAEKAEENKQRIVDLADALAEVDGDMAALDWGTRIREQMNEVTDSKEWFEFWQNTPVTRFEEWSAGAKRFGFQMQDVYRAQMGDAEALARINGTLDGTFSDLMEQYRGSIDANGSMNESYRLQAEEVRKLRDAIASGAMSTDEARRRYEEMAEAAKDTVDPLARAGEASRTFSENLTDNLSVADEGLDQFVKKGKLKIGEWTAELRRRARENKAVQDFTVNVAPKLSPEAAAAFAELPTDTQALIAKAFKSGSKGDRKKIVQNLEAEAKVTKVDINTSDAQKTANASPIKVPTTVVNTGAIKGAQEAADAAQKVANRDGNKIEFKTKVNDSGLQGAVNAAAAAISPPTIWVNVKARKDVP